MSEYSAHQRHWNEKYARGNTHSDYRADNDLVNLIHHFPDEGIALDVACGTGRNSFILAEYGLDVICLDFSVQGLNYLKNHRSDETVSKKLFPVLADLQASPLSGSYFDVLTVIRYLDRKAFESYIDLLKPSGLLFFKAFNINHLKRKPGFNPDYLLMPGELKQHFKDFEILYTNDEQAIEDDETVLLLRK